MSPSDKPTKPSFLTEGTLDDAQVAVISYIEGLLPDVMVILGQENNNSPPQPPFVMVNPGWEMRLGTNTHTLINDGFGLVTEQPSEVTMQVDIYGQGGGTRAALITTLWRDPHACEWFSANAPAVAPLYARQRRQTSFINEGSDYEERWTVELVMQVNQTVTQSIETAIYPGPIITKEIP